MPGGFQREGAMFDIQEEVGDQPISSELAAQIMLGIEDCPRGDALLPRVEWDEIVSQAESNQLPYEIINVRNKNWLRVEVPDGVLYFNERGFLVQKELLSDDTTYTIDHVSDPDEPDLYVISGVKQMKQQGAA